MSTHPRPEVHWEEGMFLRPQHLQLLARDLGASIGDAGLLGGPYRWGVRDLQIGAGKLKAHQVSVVSCDLVMPTGTRFAVPGNANLPAVDFKSEYEANSGPVNVRIGVPIAEPGSVVVADTDFPHRRYRLLELETADENTGVEEPVRHRLLNGRVFIGDEDASGYETLMVARVVRKSEIDDEPVLDHSYVPPLLRIAGNHDLMLQLQEICDSLRAANQNFGEQIARREADFAIERGRESTILFKLLATNSQVPILEQTCRSVGVHPFDAYRALCGLAGSLALFSDEKSCPKLPIYDHDDIHTCFSEVIDRIRQGISMTDQRNWERRTFQRDPDDPRCYHCDLEERWLGTEHEIFVGVESDMPQQEADQLVRSPDLRLCGKSALKHVERGVVGGVKLSPPLRDPVSLPRLNKTFYYEVQRGTEPEDEVRWKPVIQSQALSLFLRETSVQDDIRFHLFVGLRE